MGLPTRIATVSVALALLLGGAGAGASHNIQRGISLHYKQKDKRFKGRIKSDPPVCLAGTVTLYKVKKGPNKAIGSDVAAADGRWSVSRKSRKGRFYATAPGYDSPSGFCFGVRSPVLELG